MYYTIRQMAELSGVTEHTLRFYTDKGLLPCTRDGGNRRVFNEESVNWMQGIQCLKGCGASIEDIQEYCRLCLLEESEENLRTRYAIIRKQREEAYRRLEEAKATVKYMEDKAAHYEAILAGLAPDDTNRKSQAKNAVLFQQTILRYFVHFWQHEKATRQSPAGSLCFIVLFPCYFRVLCVRFSLKYERAGAARPPPPSTRPAPCSHSARLKPFAGSCSSRFGFA